MTTIPRFACSDKIAAEMYSAAERERKEERNYLGASEIGVACDRRLWLSFRGYPKNPIDGRLIMLFELGDIIEQQVIHYLNAAGFKVDGQQAGFKSHNGFYRGSWDGIVYGVTNSPHILEIKSANDKRFAAFKKFGVKETSPQYFCQSIVYMGYAKLDRALFVIVNKNTSEIYTERVYFNQEDFEALDARAKYIITSNAMPEKADDCDWCPYKGICDDPHKAMFTRTTCGSCDHLWWDGLTPTCRHQLHQHNIEEWGVSCPEWSNTGVPF